MARFFIEHPVFAWVIAILITLAGILSITRLPIEAYPDIAPPQVQISANYPGADAEVIEHTVTQIIEQSLTGIDHFHEFFEPMLPDVRHIDPPYCYRCPLGLSYPSCELACAHALKEVVLGGSSVGRPRRR